MDELGATARSQSRGSITLSTASPDFFFFFFFTPITRAQAEIVKRCGSVKSGIPWQVTNLVPGSSEQCFLVSVHSLKALYFSLQQV